MSDANVRWCHGEWQGSSKHHRVLRLQIWSHGGKRCLWDVFISILSCICRKCYMICEKNCIRMIFFWCLSLFHFQKRWLWLDKRFVCDGVGGQKVRRRERQPRGRMHATLSHYRKMTSLAGASCLAQQSKWAAKRNEVAMFLLYR